ncbi:hypothetical protein [Dyella lutea]|uniref:Uncharacterized protein n=1 Tax=Dyella lutea TaxID=2950441 RepID=A0ABT1FF51_9GAMM|nr:hypothetical protein [Dyella lutea]MCP1376006.1 hypothetical protein [Dyella lutea]
MNITKRLIKDRLGFTTDVQVADWFGVTKQAVGRWEEDEPIPQLQRYRAVEKRPDLFSDEVQAA